MPNLYLSWLYGSSSKYSHDHVHVLVLTHHLDLISIPSFAKLHCLFSLCHHHKSYSTKTIFFVNLVTIPCGNLIGKMKLKDNMTNMNLKWIIIHMSIHYLGGCFTFHDGIFIGFCSTQNCDFFFVALQFDESWNDLRLFSFIWQT